MDNVKVIDNFLPNYIQDKLDFLSSSGFGNISWRLSQKTSYSKMPSEFEGKYKEGTQLVNKFIDSGQFLFGDMSHYFFLPLQIASIKEKLDINLNNIQRAKINLKFKQCSNFDSFINPPHQDNQFKNSIIGIYYINDSDGDTIIYEGNDKSNVKPIQNISPKKGRMVLMDGATWHSASHPIKTETRKVINYNIVL